MSWEISYDYYCHVKFHSELLYLHKNFEAALVLSNITLHFSKIKNNAEWVHVEETEILYEQMLRVIGLLKAAKLEMTVWVWNL